MKKKIMALSLAFVLVVGATFGITLAWLTDDTDKITNTFTVGNVKISLHEKVNFGTEETKDAKTSVSGFKIIPGTSQTKAPYVTVELGSEDAYVFMLVKNTFAVNSGVSFEVNDGWTKIEITSGSGLAENYTLYAWGSDSVLTKATPVSADVSTGYLFDKVEYASTITSESIVNLDKCTIEIQAFAIQASGSITEQNAKDAAITWAKQQASATTDAE